MFIEPSKLEILAFHFCLALLLFLLVNILGRHSRLYGYMQLSLFAKSDEAPAFNYLFRILTPSVFIIIFSALLYHYNLDPLTKNIYLVVIYYLIFRISLNLILGRFYLFNWLVLIVRGGITVGLAYSLYDKIISKREILMPDLKTISNELWIIIVVYLYVIANQFKGKKEETIERKHNYLKKRYKYFKSKYESIISEITSNEKLHSLIFAIMIFEDFNTPKFSRLFEYLLFLFGFSKTIGLMQVETDTIISDEESLRIATKKIVGTQTAFLTGPTELDNKFNLRPFYTGERPLEGRLLYKILRVYNKCDDYIKEVTDLYSFINESFYKESTSKLHDIDHK